MLSIPYHVLERPALVHAISLKIMELIDDDRMEACLMGFRRIYSICLNTTALEEVRTRARLRIFSSELRTRFRLLKIEEELISKTWCPQRVLSWCLDIDENFCIQRSISEKL